MPPADPTLAEKLRRALATSGAFALDAFGHLTGGGPVGRFVPGSLQNRDYETQRALDTANLGNAQELFRQATGAAQTGEALGRAATSPVVPLGRQTDAQGQETLPAAGGGLVFQQALQQQSPGARAAVLERIGKARQIGGSGAIADTNQEIVLPEQPGAYAAEQAAVEQKQQEFEQEQRQRENDIALALQRMRDTGRASLLRMGSAGLEQDPIQTEAFKRYAGQLTAPEQEAALGRMQEVLSGDARARRGLTEINDVGPFTYGAAPGVIENLPTVGARDAAMRANAGALLRDRGLGSTALHTERPGSDLSAGVTAERWRMAYGGRGNAATAKAQTARGKTVRSLIAADISRRSAVDPQVTPEQLQQLQLGAGYYADALNQASPLNIPPEALLNQSTRLYAEAEKTWASTAREMKDRGIEDPETLFNPTDIALFHATGVPNEILQANVPEDLLETMGSRFRGGINPVTGPTPAEEEVPPPAPAPRQQPRSYSDIRQLFRTQNPIPATSAAGEQGTLRPNQPPLFESDTARNQRQARERMRPEERLRADMEAMMAARGTAPPAAAAPPPIVIDPRLEMLLRRRALASP